MRDRITNPYQSRGPVLDPGMFAGRTEVFEWIGANSGYRPPKHPLILHGRPGMGKSSVLMQLESGQLKDGRNVAVVDLNQVRNESLTEILWGLSKAIMWGMGGWTGQGAQPEKRMFVLDPSRAFTDNFWRPLFDRSVSSHYLLALDDLDEFVIGLPEKTHVRKALVLLNELFQQSDNVDLLLTMHSQSTIADDGRLSPFQLYRTLELEPLSADEAVGLIRGRMPCHLFVDVANYIYELTRGHPADIQLICRELYERWREHQWKQVTLSDVAAVLSSSIGAGEFRGDVYTRRTRVTASIADARAGS